MKPTTLCALAAACATTFAQSAPTKLSFEVASIKPAEPSPANQIRIGLSADAGVLRYTNVSVKDCIRVGFRVKDFQIEGPDWLDSIRYDIVARLPAGSATTQIPEMLQSLLADRFKLTLHRDTKEHAIYALIVGKNGAKLKPAEVLTSDGQAGRGGMQVRVDEAGAHLQAPSATLAMLSEMISRFSERPVVDMTRIEGQYDFDLVFSPETLRGVRQAAGGAMPSPGQGAGHPDSNPEASAGSIYDSVQKYGLKLDPRKAPMEILIVDRIEKAPTEN
jgi:uncharacterized protein (TIGR03435 family)